MEKNIHFESNLMAWVFGSFFKTFVVQASGKAPSNSWFYFEFESGKSVSKTWNRKRNLDELKTNEMLPFFYFSRQAKFSIANRVQVDIGIKVHRTIGRSVWTQSLIAASLSVSRLTQLDGFLNVLYPHDFTFKSSPYALHRHQACL